MSDQDQFDPGAHVFTGTVRSWNGVSGELVTDSGLVVPFIAKDQPPAPVGSRVTISTLRYKPRYFVVSSKPEPVGSDNRGFGGAW